MRKALVVEDDPGMRQLETKILEHDGYSVTGVDNGLAALGELQVGEVDVVILDLSMPYLEGRRVFAEISRLYPAQSKRVVFVTGLAGDQQAKQFMERTGQPLVRKPFELSEFRAAVRSLGTRVDASTPGDRVTEVGRSAPDQGLTELLLSGLDATANAVVITNADGTIEWVNPAFTRLTGYTLDEVVGQTPRVLRSGKMTEAFYRDMWKTVLSGAVWRGEIINRRKDGTLYHEDMTIAPVRDAEGRITHNIAVKQDATASVLAREALKKAREQAEESSRLKMSFLSNVSHEVRTPLNGILGIANLLISEEEDEDKLEQLGLIRGCADNLLSLMNDILDFSRMRIGPLELEERELDLGELVKTTVGLLGYKANQRGVEIRCDIDPSLPEGIKGDSTRLGQVLRNLIDNAIKFTEKGSVAVTVLHKGAASGFTDVEIRVADTGIGIPGDKLDEIWKEFVQADASTTRRFGGTGLGLSIAKCLVQQMGGTIGVESELGTGTEFTVALRFASEVGEPVDASGEVGSARLSEAV